jgi:hypothetical protein
VSGYSGALLSKGSAADGSMVMVDNTSSPESSAVAHTSEHGISGPVWRTVPSGAAT